MYWGAGSALGHLTVLGYLVLAVGAAWAWRRRNQFSIWAQDELGIFRRNLSRYTLAGPFYVLREGSRLKVIPSQVVGSLKRFPRSHRNPAFLLLLLGAALLVLDFFI